MLAKCFGEFMGTGDRAADRRRVGRGAVAGHRHVIASVFARWWTGLEAVAERRIGNEKIY